MLPTERCFVFSCLLLAQTLKSILISQVVNLGEKYKKATIVVLVRGMGELCFKYKLMMPKLTQYY